MQLRPMRQGRVQTTEREDTLNLAAWLLTRVRVIASEVAPKLQRRVVQDNVVQDFIVSDVRALVSGYFNGSQERLSAHGREVIGGRAPKASVQRGGGSGHCDAETAGQCSMMKIEAE